MKGRKELRREQQHEPSVFPGLQAACHTEILPELSVVTPLEWEEGVEGARSTAEFYPFL